MRVDSVQIPVQGALKLKTGTGVFASSLREGDSVKAEVQYAGKGAVVMKTMDGQMFRARMESDVELTPGDKVLLEVTGKEAGVVTLAIREEQADTEETAKQTGTVRGFEDKTLLPYASKLAQLNMPVNEETARLMRELITQNPNITLEEAAFLASNKLTTDKNMILAALSLLSNGEKADAMLEHLLKLMSQQENHGAQPENNATLPSSPDGNPEFAAPLTEWLALAERGAVGEAEAALRGQTAPAPNMQETMQQADNATQSENVDKYVEISNKTLNNNTATSETTILKQQSPVGAPTVTDNPAETAKPTEAPVTAQTPDATKTQATAEMRSTTGADAAGKAETAARAGQEPQEANNKGTPDGERAQNISGGRAIAELLSELREFQGAPTAALERFSNMLLRVSGDSKGISSGGNDFSLLQGRGAEGIEKLEDLLYKMFARIEKNDKDTGMRLKNAKEELFARLALLEEAISRAEPPAKTMMLEQTRKLMDHVRVLNNIDQFVYMQIPVQIGEDRKTAELYMFKKKGGKRLDPENVNILLALDLENMGHWEGLINFRNKDVSVRMEVRGPAEKEYFSENTVLLHDLLAEAGFKLVNTDITYSEKETTPLTALTVFNNLTTRAGRVDFKI